MNRLISSKLIHTNVTSVKFIGDRLYAGIAGEICIFKLNNSKDSSRWDAVFRGGVFRAQNIYGMRDRDGYILVYGGRCLALLHTCSNNYSFEKVSFWNTEDWILDVCWLGNGESGSVLTAHNTLLEYDVFNGKLLRSVSCLERCILYSAQIINRNWEDLIVLAGTVFQEIVVWASSSLSVENDNKKPVLHRLIGHKGVIFHVDYDYRSQSVCSTSDDRTVRIWSVKFPIQKSENWENARISLKHTIFGHTARVWRSHFISDERIVSVGEDSLVSIWDKCGNCERQWRGHQGGAVWSLDCSEKYQLIATGGSDGGICLWPLTKVDPPQPLSINSVCYELNKRVVPKWLCITCEGDIIVVTECGNVMMYTNGGWKTCLRDSRMSSYCVEDMNDSTRLLGLGTIKGQIIIYSVCVGKLVKIVDLNAVNDKIFAIHWASDDMLVTCQSQGLLTLWQLNSSSDLTVLDKIVNLKLPACKERWSTSALQYSEFLICGDRMGSIHLYKINQGDTTLSPVHSLLKIHGNRGVSCVQWLENRLLSAGRDGTVRQLAVNNARLELLSTEKLQMDWPASIKSTSAFGIIVIGFHDVHFVIWSVSERRYLLKLDCRGGHRSWHCLIDERYSNLKLAFVQNKDVHYFCSSISRIYCHSPLKGYHSKTINAGCMLAGVTSPEVVLLTGSDDTMLRACRISDSKGFRGDMIMRNHLSSIRAVYSLLCSYNNTTYLFSAGGRGQIKVWKISFTETGDMLSVELGSHMVRSDTNVERRWQDSLPLVDPETRYMDVTVAETHAPILLVIAACSDAMLRFLEFDTISLKLEVIGVFEYHQHCLLKVIHFKLKDALIAVSMATDGKAAFWNTSEIFNSDDDDGDDDDDDDDIIPCSHQIHSMGINSCAFQIHSEKLILLTGSDDTSVCLNVFHFDKKMTPKIEASWCSKDLHSCQITGISMDESFILTAALDQRVNLLRWSSINNRLSVECISSFTSCIPDIHGVLLWRSNGEREMNFCIFGEGMQVLCVE